MASAKLSLRHVGPIKQGELTFGDLTLLVGPQASGKTIALQILKLMLDAGPIQHTMARYGLNWSKQLPDFLDLYFGEGMRGIWNASRSRIQWGNKSQDLAKLAARLCKDHDEKLFLIPAQRVLALRDGWPRPFSDYSAGVPFVVRDFSDKLRVLVEQLGGMTEGIFPRQGRLKSALRKALQESVFGRFVLQVDRAQTQKRLVLTRQRHKGREGASLPFMVWSAGQREFVPLLLGLYYLLPSSKVSRRGRLQWVVIEEPETGLHARAVSDVLLLILELVARGYRTCISTHSPQVLEAVWALRHLRQNRADPKSVLKLFNVRPGDRQMLKVAEKAMRKRVKVYYFTVPEGQVYDISDLDPSSEEESHGGWGGLAEFSSRANREVATAVAGSGRGERP